MGASNSKSVAFKPDRDIPSLQDKVILVTGGTSGLGKQSILKLAKHNPRTIWLAARNTAKAKETIAEIEAAVPGATIKPLEMELSSLGSVRCSAQTVLDSSDRLDILLLNAGVLNVPPSTTKEGYEVQFGTNHMGHALLTKLLLPLLVKTADQHGDARVTIVSSAAHRSPPDGGINFATLKTPAAELSDLARYGQSKLANLLYGKELARNYPQLTVASLHPGVVKTNITTMPVEHRTLSGRTLGILTSILGVDVPTGTLNQLWVSTSKDVVSGTYYEPIGVTGKASALSQDEALGIKFWEWTEKELNQFLGANTRSSP